MIIVSQDKKNIVNFDNVGRVYAMKHPNEKPDVRCSTLPDLEIILGSYETEERAKEVLQEIIKRNARFAMYREAPTGGREQTEMLEDFIENKIIFDTYEMPED